MILNGNMIQNSEIFVIIGLTNIQTNSRAGGGIVNNTLKIAIGHILGIIIGILAMSWLGDKEVDWLLMISLIIGGIIGILIVSGIMNYNRKPKDRVNE